MSEQKKFFKPFIAPEENVKELTVKSILVGSLFGVIFGADNRENEGILCKTTFRIIETNNRTDAFVVDKVTGLRYRIFSAITNDLKGIMLGLCMGGYFKSLCCPATAARKSMKGAPSPRFCSRCQQKRSPEDGLLRDLEDNIISCRHLPMMTEDIHKDIIKGGFIFAECPTKDNKLVWKEVLSEKFNIRVGDIPPKVGGADPYLAYGNQLKALIHNFSGVGSLNEDQLDLALMILGAFTPDDYYEAKEKKKPFSK
jgi:hypothetical protein